MGSTPGPTQTPAAFHQKDKSHYRSRARPSELKRLGKKFPAVYSQDGAAKRPGAEWQTPLAASFRQWAEEHSWAMCEQCHRLTPKKFHPKHFRQSRALKHTVKACKHCARGVGYPVPRLADVPDPLRKLPATVLGALAIFDVHTGPWEQEYNAYRAHTAPIRFSWKSLSVEERLAELGTEQEWEKGKAAFEWLRSADDSSYKHFLKGHCAFLKQRAALVAGGDVDPGEPVKWLPLRFMETVGLECAIWPHLYWKTDMTETWARSQDVRRQARARKTQREQAEELEPAIPMGGGFRGDDSLKPKTREPRTLRAQRRPLRQRQKASRAGKTPGAMRLTTASRKAKKAQTSQKSSSGPAPRPASWPRSSPQWRATGPATSCSTSSTTCGWQAPWAAPETPQERLSAELWRAESSAQCIGRPSTRAWWTAFAKLGCPTCSSPSPPWKHLRLTTPGWRTSSPSCCGPGPNCLPRRPSTSPTCSRKPQKA